MERSSSAIKSLDGLRGIAILLVLLRHAVRPFYDPHQADFTIFGWDPFVPCINGWMGVDLFFVLSGFLVTHHLLRRAGDEVRWSTIREYLTKRFLRIVPAYYGFLFIVAFGCIPYYEFSRVNLFQQIVQHLLFLQDYCGARIVVAFWSLGVEEKFYFLAPFLVLLLLKIEGALSRVRFLTLLIAIPIALRILTFASHPEISTYQELFWTLRSPFHLAADALLMGAMCALLTHHRREFPTLQSQKLMRSMSLVGCVLIGVLLFSQPLLDTPSWFNGTLLFPLLAFGFASVLLPLVIVPSKSHALLDGRLLFFFSKLSYSLYLVHMVFVGSVFAAMSQWSWYRDLPSLVQFVLYLPVLTAVSTFAALLLHYAVEKPFLIVKDRYRITDTTHGGVLSRKHLITP